MLIIFRAILACLFGLTIGSAVNMGLIMVGPSLIPTPEGVDVTNMDSIGAAMHLYEPKHFVVPFLAHALGTLTGAFTAYSIAGRYRVYAAYAVGALFLVGGITAAFMIPAPVWFIVLDLVVAYLPMAWVSSQLGKRFSHSVAH